MMKAPHIYAFLVMGVNAYLPLGSDKPDKCNAHVGYNCPSHFICVRDFGDHEENGRCICDRFYGFVGPKCLELSFSSYMLIVFSALLIVGNIFALVSNIQLIAKLNEAGKFRWCGGTFQQRATNRSILSNIMITIPAMCLNAGFIAIMTGIDKQMFVNEFVRVPCCCAIAFLFVLCTANISLVWMELVGKTANAIPNTGLLNGISTHRAVFIVISGSALVSCAVGFAVFRSVAIVTMVFSGYALLVSLSYLVAGRMVLRQLLGSRAQNPEMAALARRIQTLASVMTRYCLGTALSMIGLGLTVCAGTTFYPEQNNLPLPLQGQIFYFVVRLDPPISTHGIRIPSLALRSLTDAPPSFSFLSIAFL